MAGVTGITMMTGITRKTVMNKMPRMTGILG